MPSMSPALTNSFFTTEPPGKPSIYCRCIYTRTGFTGGEGIKNLPANAGDMDSIPGWGRSHEEGNGSPLQYSCLGNPMDRGAWQATVHRVTEESDSTQQLNKSNNIYTAHIYTRIYQVDSLTTWELGALTLCTVKSLCIIYSQFSVSIVPLNLWVQSTQDHVVLQYLL